MTIPKQVQNDYKRWYHFLEQEVQFSLSDRRHCVPPRFSMTPAVRMTGWMWAMASEQQITTGTIVRHIRCPLITEFIWSWHFTTGMTSWARQH